MSYSTDLPDEALKERLRDLEESFEGLLTAIDNGDTSNVETWVHMLEQNWNEIDFANTIVRSGLRILLEKRHILESSGLGHLFPRLESLLKPEDEFASTHRPVREDLLALEMEVAQIVEGYIIAIHQQDTAAATGREAFPAVREWAERLKEGAIDLVQSLKLQSDCLFANDSGTCICNDTVGIPPLSQQRGKDNLFHLRSRWATHLQWDYTRQSLVYRTGGPHAKLRNSIIRYYQLLQEHHDSLEGLFGHDQGYESA